MPVEGETYLRRFIEDRLRIIAEANDPRGFITLVSRHEVQAVADALMAAGALASERANELVATFEQTLIKPRETRGEARMSVGGEFGIATHVVDEEAAARWRAIVAGDEAPSEPLRVVPVIAEIGRFKQGRLIVLSVDVWTLALRIRYAVSTPGPQGRLSGALNTIVWLVSDDVGTSYRAGGGNAGGGKDWIIGEVEFKPALSPEARSMTVKATAVTGEDIGHLTIPLRGPSLE